jgi:hypothetical protein
MKTFRCDCGNTLYFENYRCTACDRPLGYIPELTQLCALEEDGDLCRPQHPAAAGMAYRYCANYPEQQVCNWLVPADDPDRYCRACRLNEVIPNLDVGANRRYWYKIEVAKRRLLYTLFQLGLPVTDKQTDPDAGLAFSFLEDKPDNAEFTDDQGKSGRILTGHDNGMITINLAEADAVERTRMRERMGEEYRTLLGHFRHEIGHYYWNLLVRDSYPVNECRALFGDERADYGMALERHYRDGPPADWQTRFISAYASSHPFEDWAETWAHYLHMVDTLETAQVYGFVLHGRRMVAPQAGIGAGAYAQSGFPFRDFFELLDDWVSLTTALNSIARSMGLGDVYPFVLCEQAKHKLHFVHRVIAASTER